MSSTFTDIWKNLSSKMSDQENRQRYEDIASMFLSFGVAEAVPGVGEVQMALMFMDFIDPYGYNQALTRDTLNKILVERYKDITDLQNSTRQCYLTQDPDACVKAKLSSSDLTKFASYTPEIQNQILARLSSWAYPVPPEVNYPDLSYGCFDAYDFDSMNDCKNQVYKKIYQDFWTTHQAQYQANAAAAHQAAINQAAQSMIGTDSSDTHLKKIRILLGAVLVIVIIIVYLVFRRLLAKN